MVQGNCMCYELLVHKTSALLDLKNICNFYALKRRLILDVVQPAHCLMLTTLIFFQHYIWHLDGQGIKPLKLTKHFWFSHSITMSKNSCSAHGKSKSVSRKFSFSCFYFVISIIPYYLRVVLVFQMPLSQYNSNCDKVFVRYTPFLYLQPK